MSATPLTEEQLAEKFNNMKESMQLNGRPDFNSQVRVKDALTSADANIMMPKVVSQVVLQAAEPMYLASQFFKRVDINEGRSMEFIHFGALRASEIGEGQEYPNQILNIAKGESGTVDIKVKKYGLKVPITDEAIQDSQWDVIGMHLEAAGRAMARKKEEICFDEFSTAGHVVFDGERFSPNEDGYPTGRGFDGEYNGTLSADDLVDMAVSIMAAGFTPTDIIMHPLCWTLFAKNAMLQGSSVAAFGQGQAGQDPRNYSTSNALGLNVIFSPFVPFDEANKTFDFYIVDRNNIGVMLVREDISTEQFDNPLQDIQTLKIKERYGVGILNGGLGLAVAKNVAFKKSWSAPGRDFEDMPLPSDYTGEGAAKKDEV